MFINLSIIGFTYLGISLRMVLPILLSSGGMLQTSWIISKCSRLAKRSSDKRLPHNMVSKWRFLVDVPALLRSIAIHTFASSGSDNTRSPALDGSPTSCCFIFSKWVPSIMNFDLQKLRQARILAKAEFAVFGFFFAMSSNHCIHSRAVIFSISTSGKAS